MNDAPDADDAAPEVVLLPTLSPSSAMHRQLVAQLRSARDGAQDPALRKALDDVLSGRVDLRSGFTNGPLAALMASAGRRMHDEVAALSPDERADLRSRVRRAADDSEPGAGQSSG